MEVLRVVDFYDPEGREVECGWTPSGAPAERGEVL